MRLLHPASPRHSHLSIRAAIALAATAVLTLPTGARAGADTTPPVFEGLRGPRELRVHAPGVSDDKPFKLTWEGLSEPATLRLEIVRAQTGTVVRRQTYVRSGTQAGGLSWNGFRSDGGLLPPGRYRWRVRLEDRAGNFRRTNARDMQLRYRPCGTGGPVREVDVLVEREVNTSRPVFAAELFRRLCEPKSWIASGEIRWRYASNQETLVGLRTASSTEDRCMELIALSVRSYYSCATHGEVVLNADRWFGGSDYVDFSVARYRTMLVNHELGHAIGQRHRTCTTDGGKAPVMMQQSKGTGDCVPNEYPLRSELRTV